VKWGEEFQLSREKKKGVCRCNGSNGGVGKGPASLVGPKEWEIFHLRGGGGEKEEKVELPACCLKGQDSNPDQCLGKEAGFTTEGMKIAAFDRRGLGGVFAPFRQGKPKYLSP